MEDAGGIRQRRATLLNNRGALVGGIIQPECADQSPKRIGWLPAVAFTATYCIFILCGIFCVLIPPTVRDRVASENVPLDAMCYRINRRADYVTVEYAIGGPTRRVQVLLRLDKVVSDLQRSVRLFGPRVIESRSMICDAHNSSCYDAILVTNGPANSALMYAGLQFEYTNPTVEYYRYDVARYNLDLAGEMYAALGYRYYLSNTHLCVSRDLNAPLANTDGALEARANVAGQVQTNASSLAGLPTSMFGTSAVYASWHGSQCVGGLETVDVFPHMAAHEPTYLALSDQTMYESEPEAVSIRRRIVELGYTCASTLAEYERAFNFYDFDCNNVHAVCRQQPSLPFRRAATFEMRAHYYSADQIYFWFEPDRTLVTLPGLANSYEAIWLSIIKLGLLILAAAVMWVRSDRVTSSSHWLYRHCIQVANCLPWTKDTAATSVVEDAALGFAAIMSRACVSIWRIETLQYDSQSRVCVFEMAAAFVSLVSWVVRFWIIDPNLLQLINGAPDGKGPLARLGGSMAIVDASCAVLLAFAEPPILLSSISRFDNTARLLTGLLISLVTLHRCLFAVCCNAIIYEAHDAGRLKSSQLYLSILIAAGLMWIFQALSVAVAMADLVATPMAFSITRGSVGNDSAVGVVLFLALVCASLPRLMHTCVKLVDPDWGKPPASRSRKG